MMEREATEIYKYSVFGISQQNYMTQRTKTITHYQNANLLLENLSSESNLFETLV